MDKTKIVISLSTPLHTFVDVMLVKSGGISPNGAKLTISNYTSGEQTTDKSFYRLTRKSGNPGTPMSSIGKEWNGQGTKASRLINYSGLHGCTVSYVRASRSCGVMWSAMLVAIYSSRDFSASIRFNLKHVYQGTLGSRCWQKRWRITVWNITLHDGRVLLWSYVTWSGAWYTLYNCCTEEKTSKSWLIIFVFGL